MTELIWSHETTPPCHLGINHFLLLGIWDPEWFSLNHLLSSKYEPQRKKTYLDMCVHRRLKSSCASAQANLSLRWAHEETLHPWPSKMHSVKILIRLRERAGWSESSLGAIIMVYFRTLRFISWSIGIVWNMTKMRLCLYFYILLKRQDKKIRQV